MAKEESAVEEKTVTIERTTERGYQSQAYNIKDALALLNTELEAHRTIFIDGKPWFGEFISEAEILTCKKEISVTNQLIGG